LAHRRGKIKPKGLWRSAAGLRDKTIANQCSAKKKAELPKNVLGFGAQPAKAT
jgi:hypothetical protein